MKTFVVGDIHGSLRALLDVLDKSEFNNQEDRLIFLGDYVDGWSESSELIEFLIDLEKNSLHGHIFLSGNHDVWIKDWLNLGKNELVWIYNGGKSTVESYLKSGNNLNQEHKVFFNNLRKHYVDKQNRCFVHAGLESMDGVEDDKEQISLWDREFWWIQMNCPESGLNPAKLYKEVYIGHTPTINYANENGKRIKKPINIQNTWNMDTGCGWGGRLSMMNIDTKELFQSEKSSVLHPDEKGRG